MKMRLDRIEIRNFKRIEALTIDLNPVTALVGGNTSGKSSALQAAQLGVSILQAARRRLRNDGTAEFASTVANDAVLFRPTEHLLDLRRGDAATQNLGYSFAYFGVDIETGIEKTVRVEIKRGKNANIAITRGGDEDFAAVLANADHPFSILSPGLSGIPMREEWKTKGAMDAAVMHGDANMYLRTVLDHLFTRDLDEAAKVAWRSQRDILRLPECGWRTFCALLDRCYPGARVIVRHDQRRDRYVSVDVEIGGSWVTLDMASTGVLQVVQILAYACFYNPPLLLLDEPDAHLHADSQSRLYEALRGIAAETQTRILFASHSPQLIQLLMYDPHAAVMWMSDGAQVSVDETNRPAIPILMILGALSAGAEAFDPARSTVVLTEDKLTRPVLALAKANGAPSNVAVLSYNGCGNLAAARLLANMITDIRPDVRVIIHRDRDFRTEPEMNFEIATAFNERLRNGVQRVMELFTPLNDVEHSFAKPDHLRHAFAGRLAAEIVDAVVNDAIAFKRDELVNAARVARTQVESTLYASPRKRGKPEWLASAMPDKAPNVSAFLPPNGLTAVDFGSCHGKRLMDKIRPALHHHVGGATQDVDNTVFSDSDHLIDEAWKSAFMP
ncbi:MAG TPA: AAA family ATPase [Lichenihabitans sp.]|nr:AAA family ATPase [Lichenihabitans sp.]